jgi:predicted amidohydrolase
VFPVARTEIGNLAAIASEEILYPEIARCHAMRGAEVFLHATSQMNETARSPKEVATVCRALENMAYVVSANSGGITGTAMPEASADGGSKIVDYRGAVLAKSGPGETMTAAAEIDLAALRRYRRRPGMENLLSRQRFELYAESYRLHRSYPANTLLDGTPDKQKLIGNQLETIERLARLGII